MNTKITLEEIKNVVESIFPEVQPLIKKVGDNPETGYKEKQACAWQMEFLQQQGFTVQGNLADLSTAFYGEYCVCRTNSDVKTALLTEYDALNPPLGHACGHQLIMGTGLLAAAAVRRIMEKHRIPGTLCTIGCPAEEQLGGKVFMLRSGVFKDVDAAFLSHPFFRYGVSRKILAVTHGNVEFFGRSAHASTAPEQGINALDAMTIFMSGINAWRQQLPGTARVHGIITNGGTAANVIPDYTSGFFYVRSADNVFQKKMEQRFEEIAQGAALIAGCQYKVSWDDGAYSAGKSNAVLAEEAENIMQQMGLNVNRNIPEPLSTDFANVCDEVPGVNIYFDVTGGEPLALHSIPFREAAASEQALQPLKNAAVVLAQLTLNYLLDENFRQRVNEAR
ncbi:MAG: M20 family metallopeptidase [Lentisphaerae bacterium]|nr:M20 family metallopeptidase [Lentisphaerota bacterium]